MVNKSKCAKQEQAGGALPPPPILSAAGFDCLDYLQPPDIAFCANCRSM